MTNFEKVKNFMQTFGKKLRISLLLAQKKLIILDII